MTWNELRPIERTKKEHLCAATGRLIVIDSKCWHFVGKWDGEFQSWYLCEEAKQFMDDHPELFDDLEGFECQEIGDRMREFEEAVSHE